MQIDKAKDHAQQSLPVLYRQLKQAFAQVQPESKAQGIVPLQYRLVRLLIIVLHFGAALPRLRAALSHEQHIRQPKPLEVDACQQSLGRALAELMATAEAMGCSTAAWMPPAGCGYEAAQGRVQSGPVVSLTCGSELGRGCKVCTESGTHPGSVAALAKPGL